MLINDPNGPAAKVTKVGELLVKGVRVPQYAFTGSKNFASAATMIWVRNNDANRVMVIDKAIFASDAKSQLRIHFPTDGDGTGTAKTAIAFDRTKADQPSVTGTEDETVNTIASGEILLDTDMGPDDPVVLDTPIVLGNTNQFAADLTTTPSALAFYAVIFHMEDKD